MDHNTQKDLIQGVPDVLDALLVLSGQYRKTVYTATIESLTAATSPQSQRWQMEDDGLIYKIYAVAQETASPHANRCEFIALELQISNQIDAFISADEVADHRIYMETFRSSECPGTLDCAIPYHAGEKVRVQASDLGGLASATDVNVVLICLEPRRYLEPRN